MDIATFLSGVAGGSLVTGLISYFTERARRKDDRLVRVEERTAQRDVARRERLANTYRGAMVRLRAARSAFHRGADALFAEETEDIFPFSVEGSVDWAIDEADQLRTVQADIDLFGSDEVKAEFARLVQVSENMRWGFGMPTFEFGSISARKNVKEFDNHFDAVLELMRADLRA